MSEASAEIIPLKRKVRAKKPKLLIGWRELADLPELGLSGLMAKIDTGANTSALHASKLTPITLEDGRPGVRLLIKAADHGLPPYDHLLEVPLVDFRKVRSSNGKSEQRYVIRTQMLIGEWSGLVDFTLTNRKSMRFPILIGRRALRRAFIIDPSKTLLLGQPPSSFED